MNSGLWNRSLASTGIKCGHAVVRVSEIQLSSTEPCDVQRYVYFQCVQTLLDSGYSIVFTVQRKVPLLRRHHAIPMILRTFRQISSRQSCRASVEPYRNWFALRGHSMGPFEECFPCRCQIVDEAMEILDVEVVLSEAYTGCHSVIFGISPSPGLPKSALMTSMNAD